MSEGARRVVPPVLYGLAGVALVVLLIAGRDQIELLVVLPAARLVRALGAAIRTLGDPFLWAAALTILAISGAAGIVRLGGALARPDRVRSEAPRVPVARSVRWAALLRPRRRGRWAGRRLRDELGSLALAVLAHDEGADPKETHRRLELGLTEVPHPVRALIRPETETGKADEMPSLAELDAIVGWMEKRLRGEHERD